MRLKNKTAQKERLLNRTKESIAEGRRDSANNVLEKGLGNTVGSKGVNDTQGKIIDISRGKTQTTETERKTEVQRRQMADVKKGQISGSRAGRVADIKKEDLENIPVRRAEKTPRQKQEEKRFICVVIMAACVLFMSGWSVIQWIRNINMGGTYISVAGLQNEMVEDNSKNDGKQIDVDELARKVLDNVAFAVELNRLEDSVAEGMIAVTEGTKLQVYMGNGTYADELVIMTALNESDAEKNQKNIETHLKEMRKQFNDYIPEEVQKIDNAIQVRSGCYVVVCVTSDTDTAKKTIEAFLKQ